MNMTGMEDVTTVNGSVDAETAIRLKELGNADFKDGHYTKAIENYSKAIESPNVDKRTMAICLTNRAQCHIKIEEFGTAIEDATKALAADPTFHKAYFRRATANMSIAQPKLALKDFKLLAARQPGNKDAAAKLAECEKIVRRIQFEKAIESESPPSAWEGFDPEDLDVESDYDGCKLDKGISVEFIEDMIVRFKNNKRLHRKYVYRILWDIKQILMKEPTMVEIGVEDTHTLTICGDTHGQFYDVLEIFRRNGFPSETHHYLFNGDFVDRGSWSTEVALLLYAYKVLYPTGVHINRGNHETDDMNKVYGFEGECKSKYNDRVFKMFSETFSALPLATLVGKKYLVLHGGLFSKDGVTLNDIRKIDRHARRQPAHEGLVNEMLWTDPQPNPGRGPSKRGVGLQFGPDITKAFCDANGLDAVIRSHEVRMGGYEVEHDKRLVTVFSAPNYCDSTGNSGAWINIKKDLKLQFETFEAVPHPNVKPMAYASNLVGSMM